MTSQNSAQPPDSTTVEAFSCVLPVANNEFAPLADALTRAGATLFYYPGVRTEPLPAAEIQESLNASVPAAPDADNPSAPHKPASTTPWLLLTSHAAVHALTPYLSDLRTQLPIATVGRAAAFALSGSDIESDTDTDLRQNGSILRLQTIHTDLTIQDTNPDAAATTVTESIPTSAPLIMPVAAQAHEPLLGELRRRGYTVTPVPVYRRFMGRGGDPVAAYLFQGGVDAIFFPSPEHLRFFRRRLMQEGGVLSMLDHVRVYCWDNWTATVAREYGLSVTGVLGTLTPEHMQHMLQARA
ncbi:MAG: uroporphyrinogen-III synthase [Litorilinea sp.]